MKIENDNVVNLDFKTKILDPKNRILQCQEIFDLLIEYVNKLDTTNPIFYSDQTSFENKSNDKIEELKLIPIYKKELQFYLKNKHPIAVEYICFLLFSDDWIKTNKKLIYFCSIIQNLSADQIDKIKENTFPFNILSDTIAKNHESVINICKQYYEASIDSNKRYLEISKNYHKSNSREYEINIILILIIICLTLTIVFK